MKKNFQRQKIKIANQYENTESESEALIHFQLKEFVIYLIFVIVFTIWIHGTINTHMRYFTFTFRNRLLSGRYDSGFNRRNIFTNIETENHVWNYLDNLVRNGFNWHYWYDTVNPVKNTSDDDKNMMYENKLLGRPRIRQVRVRNNSCTVHYEFGSSFNECYNRFTYYNEEKSPYGLQNGSAWVYNDSPDKTLKYWGMIAEYDNGGYWIDLSIDPITSLREFYLLREHSWIDLHTRAIFVDFSVYNVNLNLFCIVKLIMEFPPAGGVIPSYDICTLKLTEDITKFDYFSYSCFLIMALFVVYFIVEEIIDIMFLKFKYFIEFWNYIDLAVIFLLVSYYGYYIYRRKIISTYIKSLEFEFERYISFEHFCSWQRTAYYMVSIAYFFVWIKFFKYLNFNKTMSQLSNTLTKSAKDLLGFGLLFMIMFIAFSQLGYLLFGTVLMDYSSLSKALFTSVRTILGDFDYEHLQKAHFILGPLYVFSYTFCIFLVLVNMFLAIINDAFCEIKRDLKHKLEEITISKYLHRGCDNLKRICRYKKCSKKNKPNEINSTETIIKDTDNRNVILIQYIIQLLKNSGFTEDEIEKFIQQYKITEENLNVNSLETLLGFSDEMYVNRLIAEDEHCLDKPPAGDEEDLIISQLDVERYNLYIDALEENLNNLEKKIGILQKSVQLLSE